MADSRGHLLLVDFHTFWGSAVLGAVIFILDGEAGSFASETVLFDGSEILCPKGICVGLSQSLVD